MSVGLNDLAESVYWGMNMFHVDLPKQKEVRHVPEYARKKEQPRNEKCNCGSALKYKKCCGR